MTDSPYPYYPPVAPRERGPRWPLVLVAVLLAIGLVVALLWPVKVPYYAMSPGPIEAIPDLIDIPGREVAELSGSTYLLTVGLREVNAFEWIEARFFDSRVDLVPRDVVRPPGVTREQQTRSNLQAMDDSIQAAVFVALRYAGYEPTFVGNGAEVIDTVEGAPAHGLFEPGDVVTEVEGTAITTQEQAGALIRTFGVGDTITVSVLRGDEAFDVEITLVPHTQIEGAAMVGVLLGTIDPEVELPFEVNIDSRNIGGPSAGLMYTLTLIDMLSDDDLMRGYRVAGTGTIRLDETVGAIGGVRQKVFAARALDIDIVFVPQPNYETALTAQGDGIIIVPVETLQDAIDYLEALPPKSDAVASDG